MARPAKVGLDYFPLDVDVDQDDAIRYLESVHGAVAFAVLIKCLMRVYRDRGYYVEWNDRTRRLLAADCHMSADDVERIILDAVDEGVFDAEVFGRHRVLTSRGIQIRYAAATARRQRIDILRPYMCAVQLSGDYAHVNIVSGDINHDDDSTNAINGRKSTQRKVEERKEEEGMRVRAKQPPCQDADIPPPSSTDYTTLPSCFRDLSWMEGDDTKEQTAAEHLWEVCRRAWGESWVMSSANRAELASIVRSWDYCTGDPSHCSEAQKEECADVMVYKIGGRDWPSWRGSRSLVEKIRREDTRVME